MIVMTNDPALTAVVAAACRLLGLNFPGDMPAEVTEERIDADPEMQPDLEDLLTRTSNRWLPWAEHATTQPQRTLGQLPAQFRQMAPVGQPPAQPAPSELRMMGPTVGVVARKRAGLGL